MKETMKKAMTIRKNKGPLIAILSKCIIFPMTKAAELYKSAIIYSNWVKNIILR